mmetsp:Transcript_372/g.542  ORF Transcript_372/g.542 Transcript_372/m.542 type:complete len:121 (-) Transcript_372:1016-1378(-)
MFKSLSLIIPILTCALAVNPDSRELRIINEAGFKCNIYWINRWKNDELVLNSEEGVFHGGETQINSYVSHEFEVQEVPSKKNRSLQRSKQYLQDGTLPSKRERRTIDCVFRRARKDCPYR